MESKKVYCISKDPANGPPLDPGFPEDYETALIQAENPQVGPLCHTRRKLPPELIEMLQEQLLPQFTAEVRRLRLRGTDGE